MNCFTTNKLTVGIFPDREKMAQNAAKEVAVKIHELLSEKEEITIIFAAAPSQNEFLTALVKDKSIEWNRIIAFHMDEYLGLREDEPQTFGNFLKKRIFDKVPFKQVHFINGNVSECQEECDRYASLLAKVPIDIVCMGIGENGHIAFNDPHVADFKDKFFVKVVELDLKCRQQQVNDGCFNQLNEVPCQAFTLTIPALMSAKYVFCIVPGKLKAQAIYNTLYGPVDEKCPASILRKKEGAKLYIDENSAMLIKRSFRLFKKRLN